MPLIGISPQPPEVLRNTLWLTVDVERSGGPGSSEGPLQASIVGAMALLQGSKSAATSHLLITLKGTR